MYDARNKAERMKDLTFHLHCHLDDLLSQHEQLDFILYVTEAWLKRRLAGHATFYVHDDMVVEQTVSDFLDEVTQQWLKPLHVRGQRQFKLVA